MDCEFSIEGNSDAFDKAICKKLLEAEAEARTTETRLSHGEVIESLRAYLANKTSETPQSVD